MGVRGVSRVGGVVRHSIKIKRVVLLQGEGGVVGDRGGSSGGQGEGGGPSHPGAGGGGGSLLSWFLSGGGADFSRLRDREPRDRPSESWLRDEDTPDDTRRATGLGRGVYFHF